MMDAREIEEREFTVTVLRGYKLEEVDDFLDEVAQEIERLHAEKRELEAELTAIKGREKRIAEMEQTLRDTLLTAQRAAEDVLRAAKEKAAAMVKDSELEGKRIVEEAEHRAEGAVRKLEAASRDVAGVKALIRRILGEQMKLLDESYPEEEKVSPLANARKPALADFDRTQEFSVREVREQAMEEEREESPATRENAL